MAGHSSRFTQLGIKVPKWSLTLNSKTLLELSLESLKSFVEFNECNFYFVTLQKHNAENVITNLCEEMKINRFTIHTCGTTPNGQALSAYSATRYLNSVSPLIIWNIDTLILPHMNEFPPIGSNWLTLSNLPGHQWSFASVYQGQVIETAEKKRISDLASIGLYGFQSNFHFNTLVQNARSSKLEIEMYVAPLYNQLINNGLRVLPHFVDSKFVFSLGTPREYLSTALKLSWKTDSHFDTILCNFKDFESF